MIGAHRVAAVLCGHSHVATAAAFAGTVHAAAPATAWLLDAIRRTASRELPGVGYQICTIREHRSVINPVLLGPSDPT